MVIPLIWTVLLCFLFLIIGIAIPRPKPKYSGRLIIDETGETERWSFIVDDALEDIKVQESIYLKVERRT